MKSKFISWFRCSVFIGGLCCMQALHAQAVFMDGSGHLDMRVPSSAWTPADSVTGARLLWYPDKYAFRFGLSSVNWNSGNIGEHSFAGGEGAKASGARSFAFGGLATAADSIAFGTSSRANAISSVAIGLGAEALAAYSVAIGGGDAVMFGASTGGAYAVAIGTRSRAWEKGLAIGADSYASDRSTAIGYNAYSQDESLAISSGTWPANATNQSMAIGYYATADGVSTAVGPFSYAVQQSVAIGSYANAYAPRSIAIGVSNDWSRRDGSDSGDGAVANSLDPLFSVGNGLFTFDAEGNIYPVASNAFTIYRDGVTRFTGLLQIPKTAPYIEVYDPSNPTATNLPRFVLPTVASGSFSFSGGSKLGVGTMVPAQVVHVVKENNTLIEIQSTNTGASNTGLTLVTPDRTWTMGSNINGAGVGKFNIYDGTANANRLAIDSAGNVGIGTSAPITKLDVAGDAQVQGKLRIPPSGDLSMGDFTVGVSPAP